MPIVYIHGVATRTEHPSYDAELKRRLRFLERYVAPALATGPRLPQVFPIYWGDKGAHFAWNRISRPRTPLASQGGPADSSALERTMAAATLRDALAALPLRQAASAGRLAPSGHQAARPASLHLADLSPSELSDLLSAVILSSALPPAEQDLLLIAADQAAYDPATAAALRESAAPEQVLERAFLEAYNRELGSRGLASQGPARSVQHVIDLLQEAYQRGNSVEQFLFSRAVVELWRKPLHDGVALFLGDVLTYVNSRGDATSPGPIITAVLAGLRSAAEHPSRQADEPLVVLTHSMGGQIIYDLVTHFLPGLPEAQQIRVDFWCATASQVGFFEELKLFKASSSHYSAFMENQAPMPDRRYLGAWWNIWDHNDVLSFTVRGIFPTRPLDPSGVEDEEYDSGMSLADAHGGYLDRPTFFRKFAQKLELARKANWYRP